MVGRIYRNGTSNSNNWQQCRLSNNVQYLDAIVLKTGGVFCAGLWIKWTRIPWYFYPSSYSVTNVTEYRKGADDPVSYRYCRKPETVETRSLLCVLVSTLCDFPECTEYTNSRQVQQKWRVARRQRRGAEKYNEHSVKRSWNAVKVSMVNGGATHPAAITLNLLTKRSILQYIPAPPVHSLCLASFENTNFTGQSSKSSSWAMQAVIKHQLFLIKSKISELILFQGCLIIYACA